MNSKLSVKKSKKRAPSESLAPPPMRHVSARTQPHSVAPHHIRSSSKIRYFFDFFAHPRFLRTLAHPPQTNAPSHPPSHSSAKPLSGIVCRPIACGNTGSGYAIAPFGAIRSAYRPISLSLNTGSGYAIAPNGAIRSAYRPISLSLNTGSGYAIAPNGAIRSAYRPISLSLNTGSCHPGVALRYTPGCILALLQGARVKPAPNQSRPQRGRLPPSHAINARAAGVFPPRPIYHICRRQMSIPPRHLWRGGGRQAGGEVMG